MNAVLWLGESRYAFRVARPFSGRVLAHGHQVVEPLPQLQAGCQRQDIVAGSLEFAAWFIVSLCL